MKIQFRAGKFDPGTCTTSMNLTENGLTMPAASKILRYTESRMLSTILVDAGSYPGNLLQGRNRLKERIGTIPKDKEVGDFGYRYKLMGRIQQRTEIVGQIGSTSAEGSFVLQTKDRYINKGHVVVFKGDFQAWCCAEPSGTTGNWIYRFQNLHAGTFFDYATHVGTGPGPKFCFGAFSAFSEASLRGYGNAFNPDEYIQHTTIQRKAMAFTGSALSNVTWAFNVEDKKPLGWFFTRHQQVKEQMIQEDEYHKWFAKSTMKGINGELLLHSSGGVDPETGHEIIIGDGVIQQISGPNDLWGSGPNGEAEVSDFQDMMSTLTRKSNSIEGKTYYVVTGTDGFENAQRKFQIYGIEQLALRGLLPNAGGSSPAAGGPEVSIGYNYLAFNWAGDTMVLFKHPMFDDEHKFQDYGIDGKLLQSSMYVFLDASMQQTDEGPQTNIEILHKSGNGVSRKYVETYLNGLTGWLPKISVSSRDSMTWECLKEDMIVIYNTASCGIIRKLPKISAI